MNDNWIVPCNLRMFDLINHFQNSKYVVWRNAFSIASGDTVYIYIGAPYSEIRFKCIVISDNVDTQTLQDNSYAIPSRKFNNYYSKKDKFIKMELVFEYPHNTLTLNNLRDHGLGQVQIQARTSRQLQRYIESIEQELITNGGEE